MVPRRGRQRANSYEAPALRKGIRLLELLCQAAEPLSVAQISQSLEVNKHTVLRLLGTLCDEGWVVEEEGPVYRVSLVPFSHFSQPISRMDAMTAAEEPLDALCEATGETSYLSIRDGDWSLGVMLRPSLRPVQVTGRIGSRLLLHCCAPGKVLLAYVERPENGTGTGHPCAGASPVFRPGLFEQLAKQGLARQTERTICNPAALRTHLDEVVRRGYATDNEEYLHGMLCLAGPVFDYTGRVVASVGITTLTMFHTHASMLKEYTEPVLAACRKISRTLGYLGSSGAGSTPPPKPRTARTTRPVRAAKKTP